MQPDGEAVRGIVGVAGVTPAASPVRVDLTVTLDAKAASVMADAARRLKNRFSIGEPPGALPVKDERSEDIEVTPVAKRAKRADENAAPGAKPSAPVRATPAGGFTGARVAGLQDSAERSTEAPEAPATEARVAREETRPSASQQPSRREEETHSPSAAARARERARAKAVPGDGRASTPGAATETTDVAADAAAALARKPQAVDVQWFPARPKSTAGPPGFKLDRAVELVLREAGVTELYSHQKEACDAVLRRGASVVVATPTASGKSLAYVVPLLTRLSERRSARAVLLFPLKALANDQIENLRRFTAAAGRLADSGAFDGGSRENASLLRRLRAIASVSTATCDGDSSTSARAAIKSEKTQIILTNPDALHHFVLPGFVSGKFSRAFFQNLEFVVVDEAHAHTGVEGSHVANVLRRLLRVCRECGNENTRFVCTSATIANPAAHVRALTTVEPAAVTESGAPRAPRAAILWRPPDVRRGARDSRDFRDARDPRPEPKTATLRDGLSTSDGERPGGSDLWASPDSPDADAADAAAAHAPTARRSALAEAADVVADLVRRRASCLCFVTARALTERLCRDVRDRLMKSGDQALALRVDSYRGGYGAEERRSIERKLQRGDVLALVTTSALEMGIDVGSLDATVHVGVPTTASSMWQQAGRAGRRGASAVAVVIARETPLDAYYLERPAELWRRAPEPATVDPANVAILEQHLPCAAHEVPIDVARDTPVFDDAALGRRLRETAAGTAAERAEAETSATRETSAPPAPYQTPYLLALKRSLAPTRRLDSRTGGGWHDGTPLLVLDRERGRATCRAGYRPHADVSLRGFPRDGHDWIVLDVTKGACVADGAVEVERVEPRDAMKRVYPGCLFSCRRGVFRVVGPLSTADRVAKCLRVPPAESRRRWTSPTVRVTVTPAAPDPAKGVPPRLTRVVHGATRVHSGRVTVEERVVGFVSAVRGGEDGAGGGKTRMRYPAPLLAGAYATDATWWDVPRDALAKIPGDRVREAAWGVLNLVQALAPSAATCDARDVGGTVEFSSEADAAVDADARAVSGEAEANHRDEAFFPNDSGARRSEDLVVTMCLYDAVPGGVGLASRLFRSLPDAWEKALDAVSRCACLEGCPSCVRAGARPFETDKRYARVALEAMTAAWLRSDRDATGNAGSTFAAARSSAVPKA